jgi:hypothetical protein
MLYSIFLLIDFVFEDGSYLCVPVESCYRKAREGGVLLSSDRENFEGSSGDEIGMGG